MDTVFESEFKTILHGLQETYGRQMQDTIFSNKIRLNFENL